MMYAKEQWQKLRSSRPNSLNWSKHCEQIPERQERYWIQERPHTNTKSQKMTDAPEEHKLQPQRKKKPPQMQPNGLQSRMWRVEGIVDSCCGHVSWSRPCDGSALVHRDSAKNSAPRLRGTSFSRLSFRKMLSPCCWCSCHVLAMFECALRRARASHTANKNKINSPVPRRSHSAAPSTWRL